MAKPKPQPFRYYTTVRVRFSDTDAQGHVNFAQHYNYFDEALTGYLRDALGYGYSQILADGLDLLYAASQADYHSPAYFEETLRVHCRLVAIGNSSMRFEFQTFAETDDRLIATGSIVTVMAERQTWKKVRVPDRIREANARWLSQPANP